MEKGGGAEGVTKGGVKEEGGGGGKEGKEKRKGGWGVGVLCLSEWWVALPIREALRGHHTP